MALTRISFLEMELKSLKKYGGQKWGGCKPKPGDQKLISGHQKWISVGRKWISPGGNGFPLGGNGFHANGDGFPARGNCYPVAKNGVNWPLAEQLIDFGRPEMDPDPQCH